MANLFDIFESDTDESEFSGFSGVDSSSEDSDGYVSPADDDDPAEWSNNFRDLRFEQFTEQPGPNLPQDFDPLQAAPLDYFWLLFPLQLVEAIVQHTNAFFRWKQAQPGAKEDNEWVDTTVPEMRTFLGLNILMGICQLPEADMFWSSNSLIGNSGVSNTMSANRFQKLLQYFHVADRASEPAPGTPGYDRLFKVRPVMEMLSHTFRTMYTLSREICVDEAMIKFTGRLSYRQYMPAKPIKRGVKVWMLCDANSAFLSRFEVYQGRQGNQTEHGLGHNVVLRLTDHLQHTHRFLFFDNFFTGVPLMEQLLQRGLYSCGTVRPNRKGFPPQLKKPAEIKNRGEFKVMQKGGSNLTATVWKDKRLVHHLSTISDPNRVMNASRRIGANVINVQQPHSVHSYNKYMGGVDLHDQHRAKYPVGRNGKKPWRYLFWFLLNCAIVNSFIIYKMVSQRQTKKKRFTHLDFRLELVRSLISGYSSRKRSYREHASQEPMVDMENQRNHISIRMPGGKRTCKYHSRFLRQRTETVYGCRICNVHLCKSGCHNLYHRHTDQ